MELALILFLLAVVVLAFALVGDPQIEGVGEEKTDNE
jgi:hypothetical protein